MGIQARPKAPFHQSGGIPVTERVGTDGLLAGHQHYECERGHRMSAPKTQTLTVCAAFVHNKLCGKPLEKIKGG